MPPSAAAFDRLIAAADARRAAGDWAGTLRLYRQAEALAPRSAGLKHNIALALFATGDAAGARASARAATGLAPDLWQSHALLARVARSDGDPLAAEAAWRAVLRHSPASGAARLGLADLALNEFGDPGAAIGLVAGLAGQPEHAADATLTRLMAELYVEAADPIGLNDRLRAFAHSELRLPRQPARALRQGRRRVGLISPLFSASPVYYLTYSTWAAVAQRHDLVFVNRGTRRDWATERLAALATEWIDAPHLDAEPLAARLAAAELDVLVDLGGWSDVIGLRALSAKPAARMATWVGGQSATTGLDVFDAWIGDDQQSPVSSQRLYAEPIANIAGGYVDYTPPDALAGLAHRPKRGVALVGNPAKIQPAALAAWPAGVERVTLIDRRYAHARTVERVTELLARAGVSVAAVIVPQGQAAYLEALAGVEAIVNTAPYAAGLTAVEAAALGVRLLAAPTAGPLFCSRHHLSHLRTGGRNPSLPAQMLRFIAQ